MLTNEQRAHDLALLAAQYVTSPEYLSAYAKNNPEDPAAVYIKEYQRVLPIVAKHFSD